METNVSNEIIAFKEIVDNLVYSISSFKQNELYEQYLLSLEKKNKRLEDSLLHPDISKMQLPKKLGRKPNIKDYTEAPHSKKDFIKFYVISQVLKTKHRYLLEGATLHEIGYILGVVRERVRQIEDKAKAKLKNPRLLKIANKRNSIEAIMDYKELATARKMRNKKENKTKTL